jgi:tRNA A37 threonylcarbamoyladenosine dehydratase
VCPSKENEFHTCDHRTQIKGSVAFVTSVFGMNAAGAVVRRLAAGR